MALEGWDATFDKLLKGLENKAAEVRFCLNVSTQALMQSHTRHFGTVNIICAPQLDSLRLPPALVPVILIHVGIIYNIPLPPLRADISFGRVTSSLSFATPLKCELEGTFRFTLASTPMPLQVPNRPIGM